MPNIARFATAKSHVGTAVRSILNDEIMVKVGDRVRYLNAVGGGVVVRIAKDIAYVDEDGFETPVLARECVVVEPAEPVKKPLLFQPRKS